MVPCSILLTTRPVSSRPKYGSVKGLVFEAGNWKYWAGMPIVPTSIILRRIIPPCSSCIVSDNLSLCASLIQ